VRRADRLFSIIQLLRGGRYVTARRLADRFEVSERTIYRDVDELTLSGVPIEREAGRGHRLPKTFEVPPLMFDRHEIEALVVGVASSRRGADRNLPRRHEDFRRFRLDRMRDPELGGPFVGEPDKTLAVFLERIGTIDRI